jgi:hypothetical protein
MDDTSNERPAIPRVTVSLVRGTGRREWRAPLAPSFRPIEHAVLEHLERDGWRGYCREGGLVLNLIKAMSFDRIPMEHRAGYLEGLYSSNGGPFIENPPVSDMLEQVRVATKRQIKQNFERMASREMHVKSLSDSATLSSNTCMLDFFPYLELWMFQELHAALGNDRIHRVAEKFAGDPYAYRSGWPDLTVWRGNEVKFLEVKGPGDILRENQLRVIHDILLPLSLDVAIIEVRPFDDGSSPAHTSVFPVPPSQRTSAFRRAAQWLKRNKC